MNAYRTFVASLLALGFVAGCSSGDAVPEEASPASESAGSTGILGGWYVPDGQRAEGLLLSADSTYAHWTPDYFVAQGKWTVYQDEDEHQVLSLSDDNAYVVARYNEYALQLKGTGSLATVLRRGDTNTLEVTPAFPGQGPKQGAMIVELRRFGRIYKKKDRETVYRVQESLDDFSGTAELRYLPKLVNKPMMYEVFACVLSANGDTLHATDGAQRVDLYADPPPSQITVTLLPAR